MAGFIRPPPDLRAIIDKTAGFIGKMVSLRPSLSERSGREPTECPAPPLDVSARRRRPPRRPALPAATP
jgi:hypothetical protein